MCSLGKGSLKSEQIQSNKNNAYLGDNEKVILKIWVLLMIFQGQSNNPHHGFLLSSLFFCIRTSINIMLNLCLRVTDQQFEFYSAHSLFTNPDGLQENGSLVANLVGRQGTRYGLCAASSPSTTTQIALSTPSTATTTAQRAGGPATGSCVQHSGE